MTDHGTVSAASGSSDFATLLSVLAVTIATMIATGVLLSHPVHRLKIATRRLRAGNRGHQFKRIDSRFGEDRVVAIDPRNYTIRIYEMNQIANQHGYFYAGERGNSAGATRVFFNRRTTPPPPRIPNMDTPSWRAVRRLREGIRPR